MSRFAVDVAVVGGGVVGLAAARALGALKRAGALGDVVLLERNQQVGMETSSRNSEVIHAGIYYPRGGWKSALCVEGRDMLYRYCEERGVPYRRCGKLIVATNERQMAALPGIAETAASNGVHDLRLLSAQEARHFEAEVRCMGALLSPSTGIVDSHALMQALLANAEGDGVDVVRQAPVREGRIVEGGAKVELEVGGAEPCVVEARRVINCAGLGAQALANRIEGVDPLLVPPLYLARGCYFALEGRHSFRHLVYPVPDNSASLGVHLTLSLDGRARFGPDIEWVEEEDYRVAPERADAFYDAVRSYWPELQDGALLPDYAGIRPKVTPAGVPAADWQIVQHAPCLLQFFGIESPGLTTSLALGREAARWAETGVLRDARTQR